MKNTLQEIQGLIVGKKVKELVYLEDENNWRILLEDNSLLIFHNDAGRYEINRAMYTDSTHEFVDIIP